MITALHNAILYITAFSAILTMFASMAVLYGLSRIIAFISGAAQIRREK
jgi:hypothetical protein